MDTSKKYVWLSPEGKFSDSWDDDIIEKSDIDLEEAKKNGWRLIEYRVLNDDKFEFYNMMRLK